jgi:uncharacterized membrane protein YebE (DUF533 family)
MSMKRILGLMLASRMAGRGRRSGIGGGGLGGGLGGLAAAGMLGGRRGGLGRKAGLAALGYMAYRAYQDHQAGSPDATTSSGSERGKTGAAGVGAGLGGLLKSAGEALAGSRHEAAQRPRAEEETPAGGPSEAAFSPEDQRAAETLSEDTALLLLRAMITAANADGEISAEERRRIMAQADKADATPQDRRTLERELDNPRDLDDLLMKVRDERMTEEFYLASRLAVDETTEANRAYLLRLRERLGLGEHEAAEIDELAK